MKKYILSVITTFAIGGLVIGQNFEGQAKVDIEYTDLPESIAPYEAMLPKEMTYKIKNEKIKIEQESMGGSTNTIVDNKAKKGVLLMDMMGKKMAIKMDLDKEDTKEEAAKMTVKVTDETKEIAGYKCKKAVITYDDGQQIDVWFTKELPQFNNPNADFTSKIDGFPMQYTMTNQGMTMTIKVSKIEKKKIADSEFNIPDGYEEMTMEEFQESMGGMGM